jgi:predicted DNA-binding protein
MNQDKTEELRKYYATHDTTAEMEAAIEAGTFTRHDAVTNPMASYSVRLPAPILEEARTIAKHRGTTMGAWLREAVESAVVQAQENVTVPISVLLAAAEEYRHRTAS